MGFKLARTINVVTARSGFEPGDGLATFPDEFGVVRVRNSLPCRIGSGRVVAVVPHDGYWLIVTAFLPPD
jgi:hypothetical protein